MIGEIKWLRLLMLLKSMKVKTKHKLRLSYNGEVRRKEMQFMVNIGCASATVTYNYLFM